MEKTKKKDTFKEIQYTACSEFVKEGDHVLLIFNNGYQIFAQAVKKWKGKSPPVKINKKTYSTANLIGLRFGSVLELGPKGLIPLSVGEDLIPKLIDTSAMEKGKGKGKGKEDDKEKNNGDSHTNGNCDETNNDVNTMINDNRNLVDDNTSQLMSHPELQKMQKEGTHGSEIVAALINNSSTFHTKTSFSQDKYIRKKQQKYQLRCRMLRPTASNVCQTYFLRDAKRIMNLRDDTLAQILSYANIYAGCQVLVMEDCMGIITGALAERMGGYGNILSVFTGYAPAFMDLLSKYNLSFVENQSIRWIHSGELFGEGIVCGDIQSAATAMTMTTTKVTKIKTKDTKEEDSDANDWEAFDRNKLIWPCPLKDHTYKHLMNMSNDEARRSFLTKRSDRFARKLTRPTTLENRKLLHKQSDSLILASKYNPTATLMKMLPFLAPSCPFVVLCEHMEPLVECFKEIQDKKLAINLRLSDTWMREFQVLPGRTHPNMNMGQHGGFILTGMKLCPIHGINEMDEDVEKRIKAELGGRRGKKINNKSNDSDDIETNGKRKKRKNENQEKNEM